MSHSTPPANPGAPTATTDVTSDAVATAEEVPRSRVIIASLVGTSIEFYDFYIYATAAVLVFPALFFPNQTDANQLLSSFAVFGVAFIARPLGSIVFGHFGDKIGRKRVIWFSILGILPFTLALPHVGLVATGVLTVIIGLILASAFPAIVVFAQELVPGRTGLIAGIFFGFAFGMGGIAAAVLGVVADAKGIEFVYKICSFLPLMGLLTVFLPRVERL